MIDTKLTLATGTAEREAALEMIGNLPTRSRVTLGADKAYDTADFVESLRSMNVTPHVTQNETRRRSAIDVRTTRHEGYLISQQKRKRVEETFGWAKVVGLVRKARVRGLSRVGGMFTFAMAVRIRNLQMTSA